MHNQSEDGTAEITVDTLQFLLKKDLSLQRRKVSEYLSRDEQRNNFVMRIEAQEYSVVRVYINSFDSSQVKLYYSKFTPRMKLGTICIVHGYGESSDDYIQTASYFATRGYIVNMIDLRGFGYSGGTRVNSPLKGVLSDIQNLLTRCCSIGLPTYILAHGFGSLLVCALLQENPNLPISGVIAMSPLFMFPFESKNSFLSKLLMGTNSSLLDFILINNQINPTGLTNNPAKLQRCYEGVFNYQYMTIKMAREYTQLSQKVRRDAYKFVYPLMVCYGNQNHIQPFTAVNTFYKEVSSREKHLLVVPNGYHQLFNDQHAFEEVFAKVLEWIASPNSNKHEVKWAKTKDFNLQVLPKPSNFTLLTAAVFTIIGMLIWLIRKLRKQ